MARRIQTAQFTKVIRRFSNARVLVVGDLMLDQFIWGRVARISPEAPVPIVHVTDESYRLGGAANVVHNLRALGCTVQVAGVIGHDSAGGQLLAELERIGADGSGVIRSRQWQSICKTRIIAHNQQVVRFDRERTGIPTALTTRLIRFLRQGLGDFDAVVLSDYGKGTITAAVLQAVQDVHRARPFPVILDPKHLNFAHYQGVTIATPNTAEASAAADVDIHDADSLRLAGQRLLERWRADAVLITRGEHGMALFQHGQPEHVYPTAARQVYDVTGAGDTVTATCAATVATGGTFDVAAQLANYAASVVVGKVGTATVSIPELQQAIGEGA